MSDEARLPGDLSIRISTPLLASFFAGAPLVLAAPVGATLPDQVADAAECGSAWIVIGCPSHRPPSYPCDRGSYSPPTGRVFLVDLR